MLCKQRDVSKSSPHHPAPSSEPPQHISGVLPESHGRTQSPAPLYKAVAEENYFSYLWFMDTIINITCSKVKDDINLCNKFPCSRVRVACSTVWLLQECALRSHLQLSGGLSLKGTLLGLLLLLFILQLLGYTDVILHKLVLLNVGGIVLLDCKCKAEKRGDSKATCNASIKRDRIWSITYELIFTILHLNFKSVFILNHYECFDYLKHGLLHASSSVMTLSRNLKNTYQIVWLFFFLQRCTETPQQQPKRLSWKYICICYVVHIHLCESWHLLKSVHKILVA